MNLKLGWWWHWIHLNPSWPWNLPLYSLFGPGFSRLTGWRRWKLSCMLQCFKPILSWRTSWCPVRNSAGFWACGFHEFRMEGSLFYENGLSNRNGSWITAEKWRFNTGVTTMGMIALRLRDFLGNHQVITRSWHLISVVPRLGPNGSVPQCWAKAQLAKAGILAMEISNSEIPLDFS